MDNLPAKYEHYPDHLKPASFERLYEFYKYCKLYNLAIHEIEIGDPALIADIELYKIMTQVIYTDYYDDPDMYGDDDYY